MNKKGKAILGIFGAVLFYGQTTHAAESASIGNLTETSVKISEIDMEKDFGKAGKILDSFYTGTLAKGKSESSVVYADKNAGKPSVSSESVCNAKPSKIVLSGKVPPLQTRSKKDKSSNPEIPAKTGLLLAAIGTTALALSRSKKGCFSHYSEDVQTVWDYIKPGSSSNDTNTDPYPAPPHDPPPSNPYEVHPSGGSVTCVNGDCGLP